MPRFYFHILDGNNLFDPDGEDLPDWRAAQVFAIRHMGEVLQRNAARIAPSEDWHMDVTDGAGLVLFRLDFSLVRSAVMVQTQAAGQARGYAGLDRP